MSASNRRGFLLRSAGVTLAATTVSRAALAGLPELVSHDSADTAPPLVPDTGPHYNPVVTLNEIGKSTRLNSSHI